MLTEEDQIEKKKIHIKHIEGSIQVLKNLRATVELVPNESPHFYRDELYKIITPKHLSWLEKAAVQWERHIAKYGPEEIDEEAAMTIAAARNGIERDYFEHSKRAVHGEGVNLQPVLDELMETWYESLKFASDLAFDISQGRTELVAYVPKYEALFFTNERAY